MNEKQKACKHKNLYVIGDFTDPYFAQDTLFECQDCGLILTLEYFVDISKLC